MLKLLDWIDGLAGKYQIDAKNVWAIPFGAAIVSYAFMRFLWHGDRALLGLDLLVGERMLSKRATIMEIEAVVKRLGYPRGSWLANARKLMTR